MYWIIAECGLVNLAMASAIVILPPRGEVNGTWEVVVGFGSNEACKTVFKAKERQKCVDWLNDLFLKLKEMRDGSFTRSD